MKFLICIVWSSEVGSPSAGRAGFEMFGGDGKKRRTNESPSAGRAWIEMAAWIADTGNKVVALRGEGVD